MTGERQIDEELLNSISELFLTFGLRSTSMDDISTHLKMSKKTLYQIFKNKDDVVEQVMLFRLNAEKKREILEELENVSPIAYLNSIKKHIIDDLNTLLPSNYFDLKKYHPEIHKNIKEKNNQFLEILVETLLKKGLALGVFRKDINIDIQVYLFVNQFNVLKQFEMLDAVKYPVSLVVSTIIDNFILSVATGKGVVEFHELQKEM